MSPLQTLQPSSAALIDSGPLAGVIPGRVGSNTVTVSPRSASASRSFESPSPPPVRWAALLALGYFAEHILMGDHGPLAQGGRPGGGHHDEASGDPSCDRDSESSNASGAAPEAEASASGSDGAGLSTGAGRGRTIAVMVTQQQRATASTVTPAAAHVIGSTEPAGDIAVDLDSGGQRARGARASRSAGKSGITLPSASGSESPLQPEGPLSAVQISSRCITLTSQTDSGTEARSCPLAEKAAAAAAVAAGQPCQQPELLQVAQSGCNVDSESDATTVRSPLEERGSIDGRPGRLRHSSEADHDVASVIGEMSSDQEPEPGGAESLSKWRGTDALGADRHMFDGDARDGNHHDDRWIQQQRSSRLSVGRHMLSESCSSSMMEAAFPHSLPQTLPLSAPLAADPAADGSSLVSRKPLHADSEARANTSFTTAASRANLAHRRYRKLHSYALVLVHSADAVAAAQAADSGGRFCSMADRLREAAAGAHRGNHSDSDAPDAHPSDHTCPQAGCLPSSNASLRCLPPVGSAGAAIEGLLQQGAIIAFSLPAVQGVCTSTMHVCGAPTQPASAADLEPLTVNGATQADVAACSERFASFERTFWRPRPPGLEAAHLLLRAVADKRAADAHHTSLRLAAALPPIRHAADHHDDGDSACAPTPTPMVPILRLGGGRPLVSALKLQVKR